MWIGQWRVDSDRGTATRPLWLYDRRESSTTAQQLRIVNNGLLPVVISSVEVDDGLRVEWTEPVELASSDNRDGNSIETTLFIDDRPNLPANARLRVHGATGVLLEISVRLHPVPKKLAVGPGVVGRETENDRWSILANDELGDQDDECAVSFEADRILWTCPPLYLSALPDDREFEFSIRPELEDREGTLPMFLDSVRDASVMSPADATLVPLREDIDDQFPLPFRLSLKRGLGQDQRVNVKATCSFATVNNTEVALEILIAHNRPVWRPTNLDAAKHRIPVGVASEIPIDFEWDRLEEKALAGVLDGHRLECSVTGKMARSDIVITRRTNGETFGQQLEYVLRLTPAQQGTGSIKIGLVGQWRDSVLSLQPDEPTVRIVVDAVGADECDSIEALAIDLGTTNTCLAVVGPQGAEQCVDMQQLYPDQKHGHGKPVHTIPTQLWVAESPPYEEQEPSRMLWLSTVKRPGGRLVRRFKTCLGEQTSGRFPRDPLDMSAEPPELSAQQLIEWFLTDLILAVRARLLNNGTIGTVLITYPTTFSQEQRHLLQQTVSTLTQVGVQSAELMLDEANAGAFADLKEKLKNRSEPLHSMIFDFGGGTIDIAVIRAELTDKNKWKLIPCGVTGLRDFGGQNVTSAVAGLIESRLQAYLKEDRQKNVTIPLLGSDPEKEYVGDPAALAVARHNYGELWELADELKKEVYGACSDPKKVEHCEAILSAESKLPRVVELIGLRETKHGVQQDRMSSEFGRVLHTGALDITRSDIDELIRPALEESLGRAKRMWADVTGYGVRKNLEMFLLAGSSSNLPLVWQMIAEPPDATDPLEKGGLGFAAAPTPGSLEGLKTKVARGAMLFWMVRSSIADEDIVAELPEHYVLIPIVLPTLEVDKHGRRLYRTILPAGHGGDKMRIALPPHKTQVRISFHESMDYRDYEHPLPEEVTSLGVRAPNKESVDTPQLFKFLDGADKSMEVWLEVDGRKRWIVVETNGTPRIWKVEL